MSTRLVPQAHRPTARMMRNDYGRTEYTAPVAVDAKAARAAYEAAKRVTR